MSTLNAKHSWQTSYIISPACVVKVNGKGLGWALRTNLSGLPAARAAIVHLKALESRRLLKGFSLPHNNIYMD